MIVLSLITRLQDLDSKVVSRIDLLKESVIETCVFALQNYTQGEMIHFCCVLLLRALKDKRQESEILTEVVLNKVVELLTTHLDEESVCGDLVDFLMFCASSKQCSLLKKLDVAVPTNEVMKKYGYSQMLVEKCLHLLSLLSVLGSLNIQQILSSMKDYPSSATIQCDGCTTLVCFLRADPKNALTLLSLKGIPLCVRAVDRFFDDLQIR